MAKTKIVYYGTDESKTENYSMVMYANANNEIYISIDSDELQPSFICLDRATAIKLAKELRREISTLKTDE